MISQNIPPTICLLFIAVSISFSNIWEAFSVDPSLQMTYMIHFHIYPTEKARFILTFQNYTQEVCCVTLR